MTGLPEAGSHSMSEGWRGNRNVVLIAAAIVALGIVARRLPARRRPEARPRMPTDR